MLFKEAISKRIIELCNKYNYSPNKLAEMSYIPPSTLRSLINNQVDNPSSLIIYKICKSHIIMVIELNSLFICCDGFELF